MSDDRLLIALVVLVFLVVALVLVGVAFLVAYRDDRVGRRHGLIDLTGMRRKR